MVVRLQTHLYRARDFIAQSAKRPDGPIRWQVGSVERGPDRRKLRANSIGRQFMWAGPRRSARRGVGPIVRAFPRRGRTLGRGSPARIGQPEGSVLDVKLRRRSVECPADLLRRVQRGNFGGLPGALTFQPAVLIMTANQRAAGAEHLVAAQPEVSGADLTATFDVRNATARHEHDGREFMLIEAGGVAQRGQLRPKRPLRRGDVLRSDHGTLQRGPSLSVLSISCRRSRSGLRDAGCGDSSPVRLPAGQPEPTPADTWTLQGQPRSARRAAALLTLIAMSMTCRRTPSTLADIGLDGIR